MIVKHNIQNHSAFTGKERELGWIANPAQRHDTEHPQSQPNVAVSNILHDGQLGLLMNIERTIYLAIPNKVEIE
jgi:hypothetical protein